MFNLVTSILKDRMLLGKLPYLIAEKLQIKLKTNNF